MRSDALRNEADYLPHDVEDLVAIRRAVIEAGYAPNVANGLVGWLVSKAAGERDVTGPDTRSKYRKILATLELPPDWPRGDRGPDRAAVKVGAGGRPAAAQNPRFRRSVELVGLAA